MSSIAVIGRGEVGMGLARLLVKSGWSVQFGSRNPDETKAKAKPDEILDSVPIVGIPEAAASSEFILLTVPGMRNDEEYSSLASQLGAGAEGKVIIDATNPVSSWPALEIFWDGNTSGGEKLQAALPKSFVFKGFNTVGLKHLSNPDGSQISGRDTSVGPLKMLFCGPAEQRDLAAQVISGVGFHPVYVGPIRYSRNLEAIAELWIHLGVPGVGTADKWGQGFHFEPTGV